MEKTVCHGRELKMLQKMRADALGVLRATGLDGLLPVDPDEVARRLGVGVKYLDDGKITAAMTDQGRRNGISFRHGDMFWVALGSSWPEYTRRWVVAKQLGHIIQHSHMLPCVRARGTSARVMTEGNTFAAELLMPTYAMTESMLMPIIGIAKKFNVPPRVAEIRARMVLEGN
jgi:Zn-dependent peptidase ImmA (M78 family)